MMKYLFAAVMLLLGSGVAHACNVPNPNLLAGDSVHPFVDGCSVPAVALNKLRNNFLTPGACNAVGDGVADDRAALLTCDSTALAQNAALLLTNTYRVSSNLTLQSPLIFWPNGSIKPDLGATVTLNGLVSANDTSVIFTGAGSVLTPNTPRVSVAWWGAIPSAVDAVPGFVAAIGSNRKIVCPPGNYTFNSVKQTRPRTTTNFTSVFITGQSNFELDCNDANILPGSGLLASAQTANGGSPAAYGLFEINGNSTDFFIHGLTFSGDYHSASLQNSGIVVFGVQRFLIDKIDFSGNWGGIANPMAGDWQVHGTYSNIQMAQVGLCFDEAYMIDVTFDKIHARGSDGVTGTGNKCFSVINDLPNAGTNPTGVSIPDTAGIVITNSDISNFGSPLGSGFAPVVLSAGAGYRFHGNYWHDNPGNAAQVASVVIVVYLNGGVFSSVGTPPRNMVFDGEIFANNGTTSAAPVIRIDASQIVNADRIGGITVSSSQFLGNNVISGNINTNFTAGMTNPALGGAGNYFDGTPVGLTADATSTLLGLATRQIMTGNSGAYTAAGTTAYTWTQANNATEANVEGQVPIAGAVRNLSVFTQPAPGSGQSVTVTFRLNSADTAITCTVSGTNNTCTDVAHSLSVPSGSGIDLKLTSTATAAAENIYWGIEFDSGY